MFTPRFRSLVSPLALAAIAGLFAVTINAQSLLSHYTLDGTGEDFGSLGIDGTLVNGAAYTNTDAGVGAFDEALSTGDGVNRFFSAPTGGNFALSAITIALWVNVDSASNNIDRLVSNVSGSTGFDFTISKSTAGAGAGGADLFELSFGFNSVSDRVTSADASYISDKWLFLAVTYDGANVRFYSGDETTELILNDTLAKTGSIAASAANLEIGGTPATTNDRSPAALFNDVRIYSGVLGLPELENVRVAAIPEPSTYAVLLGALSVVLVATKRNRIWN